MEPVSIFEEYRLEQSCLVDYNKNPIILDGEWFDKIFRVTSINKITNLVVLNHVLELPVNQLMTSFSIA